MTNAESLFPRPRTLFLVLAAYFLLHLIVRTLVSDSLQMDEAEQFLLTQEWRWGYGSQPPLYTWLQKALFVLLGPKIVALALLKNLLLFGIFAFAWLAAREVFAEETKATVAAASLLLFPGLVWESQRDQSHLVLATMLALATFFLLVRFLKTGRPGPAAWLGVAAGLGVIAKYNFILVLLALLAGAVTIPEIRAALFRRRAWLALGTFAVTVGAHGFWVVNHLALTLSQSHKFEIKAGDAGGVWFAGAVDTARALGECAAVPVLIFALLFWRRGRASTPRDARVLLAQRAMLIGVALAFLAVLVFKVTSVKARWFQPLLVLLPIPLVAWAAPQFTRPRLRALAGIAVFVLVLIPLILHGSVLAYRWTGRMTNLNLPFAAWAETIRAAGFERGVIFANNFGVAGNLKHFFPDSRVLTPGFAEVETPADAPMLIAWRPDASGASQTNALSFAARFRAFDAPASRVQAAEAGALHAPDRRLSLGFVIEPSARGERRDAAEK